MPCNKDVILSLQMQLLCYILIFLLDVLEYMIKENHWCEPQKVIEYNSLDEAKDACNRDRECTMFYQLGIDNDTFILCGSGYTIMQSNSFNSRLYKKCKY